MRQVTCIVYLQILGSLHPALIWRLASTRGCKNGLEKRRKQKLCDVVVKKDGVEAAEAKDRARKDAEQREKEEAQKRLDEERAAQLGKPDADVAAPDEPAGDHITTAQPANAGGTPDQPISQLYQPLPEVARGACQGDCAQSRLECVSD